jgi:formate dehydrogenase iron-sulfur subunit
MLGGLNSFFLLVDRPEVYGLPIDPRLPSRNLRWSTALSAAGALVVGLLGLFTFRERGGGARRP